MENGHQACVKMLVSYGANVNCSDQGWESPLKCALQLHCNVIAGILLNAGANLLADKQFNDHGYPNVALLAIREPSMAVQLLSCVPSLNTLSRWLVETAKSKHVSILQEYFGAVVPIV